MAETISKELLAELRSLAHEWNNRIIIGRYPDPMDLQRVYAYEECSDELNELLDSLITD